MINNLKFIIWDVDGTLYKSDSSVGQIFKSTRQTLLEKHWGFPYQKLEPVFNHYKQKYHSATKTLSLLTDLTLSQTNDFIEQQLANRHLKTDPELKKTFYSLSKFYHLALRNGGRNETIKILKLLGLDTIKYPYPTQLGPFIKVWGTVDDFNTTKPDPFIFDKIIFWLIKRFYPHTPPTPKLIRTLASQTLMVGDRPEVDLFPAKQAGFHTALVWADPSPPQPSYIDLVLTTPYQLPQILTPPS